MKSSITSTVSIPEATETFGIPEDANIDSAWGYIDEFLSCLNNCVVGSSINVDTKSLYRRPSEAADSLDRPPWNVVKRRWMASAMAPEADLRGGGVSPWTNRGALGEFAEAGMRKNGKTIHSEARQSIANLIKMCDEEARQKRRLCPLMNATERAAKYAGVSVATIKRIRRQLKEKSQRGSTSPLHKPGKSRLRPEERNARLDDFDMAVNEEVKGVCADGNACNRLIMLHVGSLAGFLKGAELVYKANTASGNYHDQMNNSNFEKWTSKKLIPNLPARSVVILDNALYHNVQVDKAPIKSSPNIVMRAWLQQHGVTCNQKWRKGELYTRVLEKKPREKIFKIDELLRTHGHEVLRLPPYNYDLSPIELVWSKSVTVEDWEGYCQHVEKLEDDYWDQDGIVTDVIDEFIINIEDDSSDDENEESTSSSSSSDSESELARPL
ncbi:hypothetical protein ANN_06558 [Periplaneta americana]|uniref:Tc1-like transposase DDE domain-containing protein n=1 Tax=Periplaneta americana TaxID=6978 RepID=A0ABQ8TDV7_PERAM|nr:hypothetical protein ANN_06558 [Periplaneta americana]